MSSSASIRHLRRLSTVSPASSAARPTVTASISISAAKSKLRSEYDPDKALDIYSSVSKHYTSPLSSRYAQELTIRRLAKSRRFADIESLVESQKNDPKITQEPYLSTLIRSYGRAGMFDHATRTYDQMDELGTPRSAISFNALLSAAIFSKKFNKAVELFDEIPCKFSFSPDKISYGMLVKSHCEAGFPDKALKILNEMEEKGVEITVVTFTTILDSLYKQGKTDEAVKLWNVMMNKGCEIDVAAYNVKIMNEQGGNPENVKGLIEEMSNAGLKPDTISYNYLMTSYCKAGMIDEGEKVYEGLEENGCAPNAATFRTLIYYLCRNGDYEKGYRVFEKSVTMHRIPDFNTMRHLVEGLVKKKHIMEAKELIGTIKQKFPRNVMNAWKKVEENLGLVAAADASSA